VDRGHRTAIQNAHVFASAETPTLPSFFYAKQDILHCRVCEKRCTSQQELSTHQHEGRRRPYCCEVCGKSYASQNWLTKHKAECKPEFASVLCTRCHKEYESKGHLGRHMLQVHGERIDAGAVATLQHELLNGKVVYRCRKCRKTFNVPRRLLAHARGCRVTRDEITGQWQCPECHKQTDNEAALRTHIWRHHPGAVFSNDAVPAADRKESNQRWSNPMTSATSVSAEYKVDQGVISERTFGKSRPQ